MSSSVVVFDILGTLFPLSSVGDYVSSLLSKELEGTDGAAATAIKGLPSPIILTEMVYAEMLRDSAALSYSNYYTPIAELLPAVVSRIINRYLYKFLNRHKENYSLSSEQKEELSNIMKSLTPRAEALSALNILNQSKAEMIALSNGAISITTSLLEKADLKSYFPHIYSVDQVKAAKPDSRVYSLIPTPQPPTRLFFVSQHSWDIHGVMNWNATIAMTENKTPFTTVYILQEEREWLNVGSGQKGGAIQPDIIARDLEDAAHLIIKYERKENNEDTNRN